MLWQSLITLLGISVLRFIYYGWKLRLVAGYQQGYFSYLRGENNAFFENRPHIVSLFKDAGLTDFAISRLEPAGWGKLKTISGSGFDNLLNKYNDVVPVVMTKFTEATGVFKHRMKESFNPLFWVEFIIKLPQNLLEYTGVSPEKALPKILNVAYWLSLALLGLQKLHWIDFLKFIS